MKIIRLEKGKWQTVQRDVVQEYPLQLTVNNQALATLVSSSHQLNFLVIGFLYLQGFIEDLNDLLSLGVCAEFGTANVLIKGNLPIAIRPTLTSGCGTGITFNLPAALKPKTGCGDEASGKISPEMVFALMKALFERADSYRQHGGIHSAAVGDKDNLLLYAEDIGRHNTLDRIAGEALFKKISLEGKILVTSGRVSSEMVAKATRLGIALIASRTSPTDMAVKMCREQGITLLGYVRENSLSVYACPERVLKENSRLDASTVIAFDTARKVARR